MRSPRSPGAARASMPREAIVRQIKDIEDEYLVRRRLAHAGARVTLEAWCAT